MHQHASWASRCGNASTSWRTASPNSSPKPEARCICTSTEGQEPPGPKWEQMEASYSINAQPEYGIWTRAGACTRATNQTINFYGYMSLCEGMVAAWRRTNSAITNLQVRGDSNMIIRQMTGRASVTAAGRKEIAQSRQDHPTVRLDPLGTRALREQQGS